MNCDIERGTAYEGHTLKKTAHAVDVCASKCRHRGPAFRGGLAGRCLEGILELCDSDGCLFTGNPVTINAVLCLHSNIFGGDDTVLQRDVYTVALGANRYKLSYMVDIAGSWELSVVLSTGEHAAGSPFDIQIEAAEPSPYKTTLRCVPQDGYKSQQKEFIIEACDGFGNRLRRGGTKLVATCLGAGSLLSFHDCKNGMYRVICDTEPTSSFSQLKVTLMGKDILNSPFVLSLPATAKTSVVDTDPFKCALRTYKQGLTKQCKIGHLYSDLCASLVKEQREAAKSYHSTRYQIVHTLPVKFTIDDPDHSAEEKRKELIERHNRLTKDIEELSAMVRQADATRMEVIDDLVTRFETSAKLHKDAVNAYNVVCNDIKTQTASIGARQELIKGVQRGDKDAVKKFEDSRTLQNTISAYYSGSERPDHAAKRIQMISRQYMSNEISSAMISVKPDRPNALAFWMMEGRFKPSRAS